MVTHNTVEGSVHLACLLGQHMRPLLDEQVIVTTIEDIAKLPWDTDTGKDIRDGQTGRASSSAPSQCIPGRAYLCECTHVTPCAPEDTEHLRRLYIVGLLPQRGAEEVGRSSTLTTSNRELQYLRGGGSGGGGRPLQTQFLPPIASITESEDLTWTSTLFPPTQRPSTSTRFAIRRHLRNAAAAARVT